MPSQPKPHRRWRGYYFFMDGTAMSFSRMERRSRVVSGMHTMIEWRCPSMNMRSFGSTLLATLLAVGIWAPSGLAESPATKSALTSSNVERHFKNIRQLTFGRQNAEAYFSFDGTKLIFQSTNNWMKDSFAATLQPASEGLGCYQMYVMDLESETIRLVSTGTGATTCGYFFPGDRRVLYSSTYASGPNCPPKPKRDGAYRWALDDYDIYAVRLDGQEMQRLTSTPGYDAEATISPDGKRIVYRASHPTDPAELVRYKELLGQRLVEPGQLEIFVMNADGSGKRQVTSNGASNFAPFFHPDGKRIIFSSNVETREEGGRPSFHLYLVADDGGGLERLTFEGKFNSFPMFSPDGKRVVWVSDRLAKGPGEFNVFLADWVP